MPAVWQQELAASFTNTVGTAVAIPVTASALSASNTVVLIYGTRVATADITSVTDTRGNTWTIDKQASNATGLTMVAICSTRQNAGALTSADTITVNATSAATTDAVWLVEEFSGLLPSGYVDVTVVGTAGSDVTGSTGTTVTTTQMDGLAIAAFTMSNGTNVVTKDAAYSAFTTTYKGDGVNVSSDKTVAAAYAVLSAPGTQAATFTWTITGSFLGILVVYKATAQTTNHFNPVPFMAPGRI